MRYCFWNVFGWIVLFRSAWVEQRGREILVAVDIFSILNPNVFAWSGYVEHGRDGVDLHEWERLQAEAAQQTRGEPLCSVRHLEDKLQLWRGWSCSRMFPGEPVQSSSPTSVSRHILVSSGTSVRTLIFWRRKRYLWRHRLHAADVGSSTSWIWTILDPVHHSQDRTRTISASISSSSDSNNSDSCSSFNWKQWLWSRKHGGRWW